MQQNREFRAQNKRRINLLPSVLDRVRGFARIIFQSLRAILLPRQYRGIGNRPVREYTTLSPIARTSGRAINNVHRGLKATTSSQRKSNTAWHAGTTDEHTTRKQDTASSRPSRLSHKRSPREDDSSECVGRGTPMCEQARVGTPSVTVSYSELNAEQQRTQFQSEHGGSSRNTTERGEVWEDSASGTRPVSLKNETSAQQEGGRAVGVYPHGDEQLVQ